MAELAAGRFVSAVAGFDAVLAIEPHDAEAQRLRTVAVNGRDERWESLVASAQAWIQAGNWTAVDDVLTRLEDEGGDPTRVKALRDAAARARWARATPPDDPPATPDLPSESVIATAPELSDAERDELESMVQRGIRAAEAGRNDEALRYWTFVWQRDPSLGSVGDLLEQEYVTRGMESFAAGSLEDAIEAWKSALEIDPEDERTVRYLHRAYEKLHRFEQVQEAR